MATQTGTRVIAPRNAGLDELVFASGFYQLAAALTTADTYEIDLFAGLEGFDIIVTDLTLIAPELDTGASPSLTFTVGDATDADGFITTAGGALGLQNSLASQLVLKGNGALITGATRISGTKVIITPTANPATGATSGRIQISAWAKVVAKV